MRECPQMPWIMEKLGEDLSDSEREADDPAQHLSDNDLAAFAAHGYDAAGASAIALHLSQCRRCRDAFTAAHSALVRYESEYAPPSWWRQACESILRALSTPRGIALSLLAGIAYLGECLLFAIALGQIVLAWVIPPAGYEGVPSWGPLGVLQAGPGRLLLLVLSSVALALLLRAVARRFFVAAQEGCGDDAP